MEGNIWRGIYGGEYMEGNIWRRIYGGEYMKANIWRRIYGGEYMEVNIWRQRIGANYGGGGGCPKRRSRTLVEMMAIPWDSGGTSIQCFKDLIKANNFHTHDFVSRP